MVMILYKVKGVKFIMKKNMKYYAYAATLILVTASYYAHYICCRGFFHQPKSPKQ